MKLTKNDVARMFVNPFYCINLDEGLFGDHQPMVTEKEWIQTNKVVIAEMGVDKWLKELLEVLKGGYVKNI